MPSSSISEVNFKCPNCGGDVTLNVFLINLFKDFLKPAIQSGKSFIFMCDACGDEILNNYRDTYGIGI